MRREDLRHLVCPSCKGELVIDEIAKERDDAIESGSLKCSRCGKSYEIFSFIPRFVPSQSYASGFGLEWAKHARTQYDAYSGVNVSETRFFQETRWSRDLTGEVILEVGSGSGRFTEQAASTGAMVVSLDLSNAVEANYASNGIKPNVLIVQGDIYRMPFREDFFDKLFCIGVLQHTPNVEEAFKLLPHYLKSGGSLVVDIYRKGEKSVRREILNTRHWTRLFTRHMPSETLYRWCVRYIEFLWPLVKYLDRSGRTKLISFLLIPYYKQYSLSESMLKEWALLDLFDILSARYEFPQHLETVEKWFRDANMHNVEVHYGYNGIEGRGIKA